MSQNVIIGVDTGNRCIKTVNHVFIAGLVEYMLKPPISSEILEYNGKYYTLTNKRISYLENKTENEDYFILTLFGISKEILTRKIPTDETIEITLAVGLPPAHIGRLQDDFINYFKRPFVNYKYNGMNFTININNVRLFPQGYAAIIPQYEEIRKLNKAYIIDIGGYTTDVILLNKGMPDLSFCESFPYGVIELYNDIQRKVKNEYGRTPDESQIDYVIETGDEIYQDMSKRINEEAAAYVDDLLRKLNEYGVDLVLSHGIFVGGGALRLKEYIKRSPYVAKKIFIPSINANAEGYEYLATNIE